jgi:hypothetical protein
MLKLLKNEAIVYEGLKLGLSTPQIIALAGINQAAYFVLLSNLISLGAIRKSGMRMHYVYTPTLLPYEIVLKRDEKKRNTDFGPDTFLSDAVNVVLTDYQRDSINTNRKDLSSGKISRKDFAREIGLSKLQLNFALERLDKAT